MLQNYGAFLHGPYDVRIKKTPVPEINEKEVLIKMECVGICGSDVKLYTTGKCANDVITEPMLMGHEGAGVVVKNRERCCLRVGSQVSSLSPGDRVAIEPTQPCRACEYCKCGRYNLCPRPGYCSSLGSPGNLCTYYKHVADFCHKIPSKLSLEEGAAVQPLAIALHACSRAGLRLGQSLLVLGAGPVGVLCAATAKAMGVSTILITDVVESRLETVKSLGVVDYALNTKELGEEQTVEQIQKLLGTKPDVAIDACAFPSATRVAMMVTKSGGVVTVVGISSGSVEVPLSQTLLREVDIRGSLRIVNNYPAALSAVASSSIDLKSFITHHFTIEQIKEALELAKTGEAMKIIIHLPSTSALGTQLCQ